MITPDSASKIAPSLLAADLAWLGEQAIAAEAGRADRLHLHIMDGHLMPCIAAGPLVLGAGKGSGHCPLMST